MPIFEGNGRMLCNAMGRGFFRLEGNKFAVASALHQLAAAPPRRSASIISRGEPPKRSR